MRSSYGQFPETTDVPPAPDIQVVGMFDALKDKSLDELHKLLTDRDAYAVFLHSLPPIRHLDLLHREQMRSLSNLASNNLDKVLQLTELKNQCTVIRAEISVTKERLDELLKLEKEITSTYSTTALLDKLKESAMKIDGDSEVLQRRLLSREIGADEFVQRCKKERTSYHRKMLTHLAAKSWAGESST